MLSNQATLPVMISKAKVSLRAKRGNLILMSLRAKRGNLIKRNEFFLTELPSHSFPRNDATMRSLHYVRNDTQKSYLITEHVNLPFFYKKSRIKSTEIIYYSPKGLSIAVEAIPPRKRPPSSVTTKQSSSRTPNSP